MLVFRYKNSGNGIGFDTSGCFLLSGGSAFSQNVNIFDADINSSVHIDNKKIDLLIFEKDLTNDSSDPTMSAGKQYFLYFNIFKVLVSNKRNFL